MAYRTTNTTDFNLDLNILIEEAYERCGAEMRTGYEFRTAKRSLSLLLMDWANRGINLWTLDTGTQVLTYEQGTYDLPVDTVDLLDHVIRTGTGTNQQDINISRISSSTYLSIPNKNATGRPIQIWIQRKSGATNSAGVVQYPQFTVWPKPDNTTTWTLVYTRLRRMFDPGTGVNGQDIPFRFMPCMVAGLAYYLSMKVPGGMERMAALKAQYDEAWDLAAGEDREKAPDRFVPRESFIG
jgi:hypothetical protein